MKFRLTYEGRLESSGNDSKRHNVWEIRKALHPQLRRLWEVDPNLKDWLYQAEIGTASKASDPSLAADKELARVNQRNGYRFVPLVTQRFSLIAALEILFLRTGAPGGALQSGDIDGRLKTLFDGLKMPTNTSEFRDFDKPEAGEDPFYVLLEDDRLINHIAVDTDTLLQPTPSAKGQFLRNDSRLVITVNLRPYHVNLDNLHFGKDFWSEFLLVDEPAYDIEADKVIARNGFFRTSLTDL